MTESGKFLNKLGIKDYNFQKNGYTLAELYKIAKSGDCESLKSRETKMAGAMGFTK